MADNPPDVRFLTEIIGRQRRVSQCWAERNAKTPLESKAHGCKITRRRGRGPACSKEMILWLQGAVCRADKYRFPICARA